MSRFSHRIGVTRPPSLAREGMPDTLRTALWNRLHLYIFNEPGAGDLRWHSVVQNFYVFNKLGLEDLFSNWRGERKTLRDWWFSQDREWYEIYDTIEHLAPQVAQLYVPSKSALYEQFNSVLQAEGSRFRFVNERLTEITDNNEIDSVRSALSVPDRFAGARAHITSALRLLGQRPEPDYRNSIQESISAVESTLKVLTGLHHADLSKALKEFSAAHPIHGALFNGLNSLYGYTSDEHGIRHALLESTANVGFPEAKFMVVACAAFLNYLIVKDAP